MKGTMTLCVFAGVVFSFEAAAACTPGPGQVAVFEHSSYGGRCAVLSAGSYATATAMGIPNDVASSIKVAPGTQAILCEDTNYGGSCQTFTADLGSFSNTLIRHDRASSARVSPAGVTSFCSPTAQQVAVFQHSNYGGGCTTRDLGQYTDPNRLGLANDTMSSVRIGANVEVLLCTDGNFLGDCELVTASRADFGGTRIGHDRTSSFWVRPKGTLTCVPGPNEVSLYMHAPYEGPCTVRALGEYATAQSMGLANDSLSAARVGANVQLLACVDTNFAKDCETFTANVPDFFRTRIGNDRISSVKVRPRGFQECLPAANQASFYSQPNFNAPCVVKGLGDYANQAAIGLENDSITSLRAGTAVQVCACVDANFMGQCRPYAGDLPDLRGTGYSSVRVLPLSAQCLAPSSGEQYRQVEVSNCHIAKRPVDVRVQDITEFGENAPLQPVGILTAQFNGDACPAWAPMIVPLVAGHYMRVVALDYTDPGCAQPCIRADTQRILGADVGPVKQLIVK